MNAIVESNFAKPHFGDIPLQSVIPSKTNPRKHFDQTKLEELAASIKSMGVAQPILVRPMPTTAEHIDCVEIVAGERRYRASMIAGMTTIPAVCRDMTDAEAMEIQIIENLQREDVHEIEEAEGYDRLMKEHGHSAVEIAKQVGKSREYIYARLKLCALSPEARQAFYDGTIKNASIALLIARIPVPKLQLQAIKAITPATLGDQGMSYRAAAGVIQERFMLNLENAPFDVSNAKLVKDCTACTKCPKRSSAESEVFSDAEGRDFCLDPDCFQIKREAHNQKIADAAKKKGLPVYKVNEFWQVARENDLSYDDTVADFGRTSDNHDRSQKAEKALSPDQLPPVVGYCATRNGDMKAVYENSAMQAALEKAGICIPPDAEAEAINKQAQKQKEAEIAKLEEIAAVETQRRTHLFNQLLDNVLNTSTTTPMSLLRVAVLRLLSLNYADRDDILKLMGITISADDDEDAELARVIDNATEQQLQALIIDNLFSDDVDVRTHEIDPVTMQPRKYNIDWYGRMVTVANDFGAIVEPSHETKPLSTSDIIDSEGNEATKTTQASDEVKTSTATKKVITKKSKAPKVPEPEPDYPADDEAAITPQESNPLPDWPFPFSKGAQS